MNTFSFQSQASLVGSGFPEVPLGRQVPHQGVLRQRINISSTRCFAVSYSLTTWIQTPARSAYGAAKPYGAKSYSNPS